MAGDARQAYLTRERVRKEVLAACDPVAMREALRRLFPCPCRQRYTALTLLPQLPWYRRPAPVCLALTTAAAGITSVYMYMRYRRR